MIDTPMIDPTWSVYETRLRVPAAGAVFAAFGIAEESTARVADVARREGADLDALLDALGEAARVSVVIAEARRVVATAM